MTTHTLSRREFLRGALGLTAGALALSLPLAACAPREVPVVPAARRFFSEKEWAVFDAASRRLLPAGPGRIGAGEANVVDTADTLLAKAPPGLQADIKKLLNLFEDGSWLMGRFQPFTRMPDEAQDRYLAVWASSPVGLMRQGFVGLNRLASMLFYMNEASWKQIGYAGPWIGRYDFGLGPGNQGPMARNPNPNIYARFPA